MNRRTFWVSVGILAMLGTLLIGAQPASAGNCMQDKFGKALNCTANDVQVAYADNPRDVNNHPMTKCISGDTFSFIADFHVTTTASSRYDIGLWFATDADPNGDGAISGTCSVNMITPLHTDPASPGVVTLGTAFSVDLDNDACRDINTANGWGPPGGRIITVRVDNVVCAGDKFLSLPNCTSWSQNTGGVCLQPSDTVPGSPAKCHCDKTFTVPILVDKGQGNVTKDATPTSLDEPGGEFTFDISFKNTSAFVNVTLDKICDDKYGTIAYNAGSTCPAGTLGSINSTTCSLPQTLAPGATYPCSFKANFTASVAPASATDTVTFYGHDSNPTPNPVSGSASATVTVADVKPNGTITKSLDSLQCAVVRYKVKAVNNKPDIDTLLLTALTDSGFGDVTKVQGDVKATTCVLGTGVSVGSTAYECTFDAYFCGASHTDTVTATWHDNDGNETTPTSNSVTVNVGATQQP